MDNIKKKMNELYSELEKYNYHYHVLDESLISDYEYDKKIKELEVLEEENPKLKKENSVTSWVGNVVIDKFEKVEHKTSMLSLDNAFTYEDLVNFDNRVKKEVDNYSYVCELKIDGIAISIDYKDKKYFQAVTRGNGKVGENVTHNVSTIKSLPRKISQDVEVRGEIYIDKKSFLDICKREDTIYANPRNLASGTVRQLNNEVAKNRNLNIFVYGLANYKDLNHKTYFESMDYLKGEGFSTNQMICKLDNIDDVYNYINEMTQKREGLDYEIDGIVIKVNEYANQEKLGMTAKYPKWAIAWKFKSDFATTKLLDIMYTVGRTGKVTPNAILEPVFLMGSSISRATLHNEDYILEKNIQVGDTVKIIKAGDIIPRVEEVVSSTKSVENTFAYTKTCPECHSDLVKIDKDYMCLNKECPGKDIEKILYFISKNGFDIDGIGDNIIKKLYDKNIVNDYVDIFDLNFEKLYQLEGFKEKSISNILNSIEKSKDIELANFLTALGIKNLGIETAKTICKKYETLKEILNLSLEDLISIDGIGQKIADEFIEFFLEENNLEKIDYLLSKEIKIKNTSFTNLEDKGSLIYLDKTFVITGSFEDFKRSELKSKIEKLGGKVSSSISKKTDFLICGKDAGSKLDKAKALGVKIVYENELNEFKLK